MDVFNSENVKRFKIQSHDMLEKRIDIASGSDTLLCALMTWYHT